MRSWFIILFLIVVNNITAQDLKEHRWQNRLLVIVTDSPENGNLKSQLALLSKDTTGCIERKLAVYRVLPGSYWFSNFPLKAGDNHVASKMLYNKFSKKGQAFTIYLMGLDGGIKQTSHKPWTLQEIYRFIDAMPMRVAEKQ